MSIADNLAAFNARIPEHVTLVAVSKTKPHEAIMEAYEAGHRVFGENRVTEMADKAAALPADIEWHFIGHLQSKKVKHVVPVAALIHSVDSEKLLEEINKRAGNSDKVMNCLLQVHIAQESTKYGFSADELRELFSSSRLAELPNVRIVGLMGMATYTDNTDQITREFATLKSLYDELESAADVAFSTLSMGMSGDYEIAIAQGSNMIRVGSAIFGARN